MCLQSWWADHERTWVCFDTADARDKLAGEDVVWAHHPTTRSVPNLIRNGLLARRLLREYSPDLIVSTGAGVAVPFFWMGRRAGARTVFLEVYDRIDSPTLTGRLCERASDLFLVQWPEQMHHYRSATLLGSVW